MGGSDPGPGTEGNAALVLQGTAIGLSVFYSLEAGHWVQLTLERERLPEEAGGRGPP